MTCIIPGSFNPFTLGHKSLVDRALTLFDRVVIAIGINADKPPEDAQANLQAIEKIYTGDQRVKVVTYSGLTVDVCRRENARWIVRGVRTVADFEQERAMADINRDLAGVETMILFTLPQYESVSSSVVRELMHYGVDVKRYIP